MINAIEACELVTEYRKEPFVEVITDIGNSFVIGTVGANGEGADSPPCMVNKINGEIDICFVPDYIDKLKKGKLVPIPKKYKVK